MTIIVRKNFIKFQLAAKCLINKNLYICIAIASKNRKMETQKVQSSNSTTDHVSGCNIPIAGFGEFANPIIPIKLGFMCR